MRALSFYLPYLVIPAKSEWCFWPNGTSAADSLQCGSNPQCCGVTQTCLDNGLFRDANNHPNGSLTILEDGQSINLTGLYDTPACTNKNYTGCSEYCLNSET